jgi:flagellar export protein FliJ
MRRFVFRLERLFRLRRTEERERTRALGLARRDEETLREAVAEATVQLDRYGQQIVEDSNGTTTAGMLHNLSLTVEAAANRLRATEDSHRAAEEAVEIEQEKLGQAKKEYRIVERLRERRKDAWSREASREEQKEHDSLSRRQQDREDKR